MSKLSKRHFWEWFKRHHQEYLTLNKKSKKEATYWLNELTAHLRAYFKFFGYVLEASGEKGILTITVGGKEVHFKKAEALVAQAPEIAGWTFVALEDPRPIDFCLEELIADTGIDPRELRFSFATDDPDDTAIIVYHPLCTEENEDMVYRLAYAAVYNLLGERSFTTDIRHIEVANLSSADADDIHELELLPGYIGSRVSRIMVDSQGNLGE